jgi:methionyl-tRNA synthetase
MSTGVFGKRCYITTPIYYANWLPHIGNAYTSFLADFLARLKRVAGYEVKFATWTDENGQKMVNSATAVGKSLGQFLDDMALDHRKTWDILQISYTDFIRTADSLHHTTVQQFITQTFAAWYIYKWVYRGYYCVGCESFKKETDLTPDWLCPDHRVKPEIIEEDNWFFRLRAFQDFLLDWYESHPSFCVPDGRFHEVRSFVEQGLEDFSVSRQWSDVWIRFPVDVDPEAVVYIWFDALYNYVTAAWLARSWQERWVSTTEKIHVLGKDISRFHAIYWPAMLQAVGLPLPDQLVINGFFTVNGQKMSKSLGNSLDPVVLLEQYWRDSLVYYLFSDIKVWSDGDFNTERLLATRENVLKKTRGNLVSRTLTLAINNQVSDFDLPHLHEAWRQTHDHVLLDNPLADLIFSSRLWWANLWETFAVYTDHVDLHRYIKDRYELVQLTNKFVDDTKPRELAKSDMHAAQSAIRATLWMIKNLALLASPFLVESTRTLQSLFLWENDSWKDWQTTVSAPHHWQFLDLLSASSGQCILQKGHLF